jgi:hypothetical protein
MSSADEARLAEALNPGWAIVWGAWHRTFTGWCMWAVVSVSVEAKDLDGLTVAMRAAEIRYQSSPAFRQGMFPRSG